MLWDIDHTLISIRGLSAEIYGEAFREITGHRMERVADMAGRTDRAIISETLRLHGITPSMELVLAFADVLAAAYTARQDEIGARGRVLPGARTALRELAGRADVLQSVLTGNIRPLAVCKLTAFGLHGFVDFDIGAYGGDDSERPPLVGLARSRANRKYGETFDAATRCCSETPRTTWTPGTAVAPVWWPWRPAPAAKRRCGRRARSWS